MIQHLLLRARFTPDSASHRTHLRANWLLFDRSLHNEKKELTERRKERETRLKALYSLREKLLRRGKGERNELNMDELDVLLELKNEISKLPTEAKE